MKLFAMKTSHSRLSGIWLAGAALCLGLTFTGCDRSGGNGDAGGGDGGEAAGAVDFVTDVKPILQTQCVRCHNDETIMGGLNLMNREVAMRGSSRGPVIVPGEPEKSLLYRVTLMPEDQDHAMPATGAKLTEAEKKILYRWVKDGAEWPEGEAGTMLPIKLDVDKV